MDDELRARARTTRTDLVAGRLRGVPLVERILEVPFVERDSWVDEILHVEPPPADEPDLPRGSVPYLPCGVDEVLAFIRDAALGPAHDLVDLGSGVGRTLLLAQLVSGATCLGIESQDHLVRRARVLAAELGIERLSFVHADATSLDLDGSHFFLYAPCNGDMLVRLMNRVAAVARRRPIVVGTVGLELHESWLVGVPSSCLGLSLYRSGST